MTLPRFFLASLLAAGLAVLLFQKTDFTRADLGQHLQTGRLIAQGLVHPAERGFVRPVFFSNFYSYTFPDFSAPNHRWASGVLLYLVWKAAGFTGLGFFYLAVYLSGFAILFTLACASSDIDWALLVSIFLLPLLGEREEIRPEIFSYAFAAVLFWVLWRHRNGIFRAPWLAALVLMQALWANVHIYFVLGPLFAALFWAASFLKNGEVKKSRQWPLLFGLLSAACLVNPLGLQGLLYPFHVFGNYGMQVVENQSVWKLASVGRNYPSYPYFQAALVLLILSFALVYAFRRERFSPVWMMVSTVFAMLAALAMRNLTLFAWFVLPALAMNAKALWPKAIKGKGVAGAFFFLTAAWAFRAYFPYFVWNAGIGIREDGHRSAEYFKRNGIKGPVFNNFDGGGFLIFHLFPAERVFIDNRTEAYPASFIKEEYRRAFRDPAVWRALEKRWGFNAIFLSRDLTRETRRFVLERLKDPAWTIAYADQYAVIFIRREGANAALAVRIEHKLSKVI